MVRRVFFALLVSGIVAQSGFAQEGTTGRGSLVGWLKSKVTGTSQPSQRKATSADVQHAVAVATGRIATPQRQQQQYRPPATQQPRQYTPEQRAAAARAAQYRAAQYRAAQERAAQQRSIQQTQYQTAQRPPMQTRPTPGPRPTQMAQRPTQPVHRPQMTPQQMQQHQAQIARARQYQAAQQRAQFASSGRTVPTRTAPMTRLRPTPASVPTRSSAPVRTVSSRSYSGGSMPVYDGGYSMGTYPVTSAGLYSSPRPNIPYQVGMTAITNQALYPHEFLYPHEYKAIYPPYYYKVKGKWMVTPFGVWSHEKWKPMGTEVSVKYRSSISPFSGFIPPRN